MDTGGVMGRGQGETYPPSPDEDSVGIAPQSSLRRIKFSNFSKILASPHRKIYSATLWKRVKMRKEIFHILSSYFQFHLFEIGVRVWLKRFYVNISAEFMSWRINFALPCVPIPDHCCSNADSWFSRVQGKFPLTHSSIRPVPNLYNLQYKRYLNFYYLKLVAHSHKSVDFQKIPQSITHNSRQNGDEILKARKVD